MNFKFLHVKNGAVVAISLEGESVQPYGQIVEVPYADAYSVGDAYPRGGEPATPVRDVNATKPSGAVPKTLGGAPKRKPLNEAEAPGAARE
jgi:hypothetical protein